MARVEDYLRRAIPTRYDVLSQGARVFFITTRKTEIANFQITRLVKQQVARFEISVNNVGRVDVEATTQQLIHKILQMVISKILA